MKKTYRLIILCLLVLTAVQISCERDDSIEKPIYGQKTLELISIVENNPNIKSMLIKSIVQAKLINPD